MKKNRLIWIIALFLINIITLPIAYAQTTTQFNWIFVLINSAIVGIILFLLQSFLIPGKAYKEKTAVYAAIIGGALLVGFLFGSQGYIWQNPTMAKFLNIYVIANALIIATLLYFILGLMKFNEKVGTTKEGLGGYGILLFLISLIFAVKIGNHWIWELSTSRQFISYLIGPEGILNPDPPAYRFWIFITSFVMFAFFMSNFLATAANTTGSKVLNYALAFVIASNMASAGYGFPAIIQLGEIIFLLVLWKGIKDSVFQGDGGRAFLIALFIIGWASAAVTMTSSDYRGVLGYGFCQLGIIDCKDAQQAAAVHAGGLLDKLWKNWWKILLVIVLILVFAGKGLKQLLEAVGLKKDTSAAGLVGIGLLIIIVIMFLIFGWKFMGYLGLLLLIPILALLGLWFGIKRSEITRRILTLGLAGLKERLNAIIRNAKYLRDTPEGREPQVFRENRILLHALANFTTRSEITYRYWGFVEDAKRVGASILTEKINIYDYDTKILREDIIKARSGGVTSRGAQLYGWNRLNLDAVDLVNEFYELTYWIHAEVTFGFKDPTAHRDETIRYGEIITKAQGILTRIGTSRENYELMTNAYGGHHVLNAYKGIILNMTNVTGDVLEHPQKFARPGAEFEGRTGYYGPSFTAGSKVGIRGIILPIHEVNQYGEYIQDIVDQKDNLGDSPSDPRNYKKPRKLKNPNDIIDYTDYSTLMSNIELDWQSLAEDIRYGQWHPHSRTFQMYKNALAKAVYPEWADDQIPIDNILTPPVSGDEAVDLRALANPSKHDYWGRIAFDAKQPPKREDPKHNPFPGLSSLGIKKYLQERVRLDMKDKAKAAEFLNRYPADTGATKKVTVGKEVVVKIGGRLSEGAEEASRTS